MGTAGGWFGGRPGVGCKMASVDFYLVRLVEVSHQISCQSVQINIIFCLLYDVMVSYGPRPLTLTGRHGHFLNVT